MTDQRSLFIAIALSLVILLGFQYFYEVPRQKAQKAAQQATEQTTEQTTTQGQAGQTTTPKTPAGETVSQTPSPPGTAASTPDAGAGAANPAARTAAIGKSPRIDVRAQRVTGSISLVGGRIDDVVLNDYHQTVDKTSPPVVLLSPPGSPDPYYANFGWSAAGDVAVPGSETEWTSDGGALTTGHPVKLTWDNGAGLGFERVIEIDDNYMFTVTQRMFNNTDKPVDVHPYGLISRTNTPKTLGYYILHEGPLGVFDDTLKEVDYKDLQKDGKIEASSTGGWLGITDKYWLAALVPDPKVPYGATFRHDAVNGTSRYQVDYIRQAPMTVPAGGSAETKSHLFAGAKEVHLLDRYEDQYNIDRFDLAVDFGWFYFLTKPLFFMLDFFFRILGNFGLAIMLLTVLVKLLFFPLANKSYRAMSKMKALQPEMMKLRERFSNDRQKLNQAMMELYKREKVNPAAGCLPIVIQIPVFFSLYKVMFVTIEMRHQPFFGWIHDLSAQDPTTIFNLFGLIPWAPPHYLMLGIWPLLMGISMFLQQRLNPQPADPIQAKVFMIMPIMFTFLLARFPAGLVVYWTWNNTLSIAQQWVIMKRAGVSIGRK